MTSSPNIPGKRKPIEKAQASTALGLPHFPLADRHWIACRELDGLRIPWVAVLPHLIVEVGTGRQTRHPHIPNEVTLVDLAPDPDPGREAIQVSVAGGPSVRMPNQYRVAVRGLPGTLDHDTVSGRLHLGPGVRRVVHTPMRPPCLQHRMEPAVTETAGDPVAECDRAAEERASHGLSVLVVVHA